MRFTAELRYQAAPREVSAMLADPRFQERKSTESGALRHEATVSGDGTGLVINSSRVLPAAKVPEAVRGLVGNHLTVTQEERWGPTEPDGSRHGTVEVRVSGFPVKLTGRLALVEVDGGSLETLDGTLTASVPLFGSKVERMAEQAVRAEIRAEQRAGDAWFAER